MFMIWFDDSKKLAADKVAAALVAYRERFGYAAEVVLVNERDFTAIEGLHIEPAVYVRANTFWLGLIVEEGRG